MLLDTFEYLKTMREWLITELCRNNIAEHLLKYDRIVIKSTQNNGWAIQEQLCLYSGCVCVLDKQKNVIIGRESLAELAHKVCTEVARDYRKPDHKVLLGIATSMNNTYLPRRHAQAWADFPQLFKLAHKVAELYPALRVAAPEGKEVALKARHGGLRLGGVIWRAETCAASEGLRK